MSFDLFWSKYPKREAKKEAQKAWTQLNPSADLVATILAALDWQVRRSDWLKDDGQFVPRAATWLRGERWEDEPTVPPTGVTKGGLLLDCPHDEPCASRWACGQRQLLERDDPFRRVAR